MRTTHVEAIQNSSDAATYLPQMRPVDGLSRDPFFEEKIDSRDDRIELEGAEFNPSQVLCLDQGMYDFVREQVIEEIGNVIETELGRDSLRRVNELCRCLANDAVVPFFGAGVSIPSGYPGWSSFLEELSIDLIDPTEVQEMISCGRLEDLASQILSCIGPNAFEERMDEFAPAPPQRRFPPSTALLEAVRMFKRHIYVTTNFDPTLERACEILGFECRTIEGCQNWSGWNSEMSRYPGLILKIHGDYHRQMGRVMLSSEYEREYSDCGNVRRDLTSIFRSRSVLFIGCSLCEDRTMQIALEVAQTNDSPRHYALLGRDGFTVERERFLTDRKIFPIWYPNDSADHEFVGDICWWMNNRLESMSS